jgi:small subunit ribosomal protein S1
VAARQDDAMEDDNLSMAELLDNPANAMRTLQRGEVIDGIVARIDPDEVLVDIGLKSEGVISGREMDDEISGKLRVGSKVLVYVMQPEGPEGHAILSIRRARMEKSWRKAEELYQEDTVIEAEVIDYNKGGLIVDLGVRGFVPISQIPELRGLSKGQEGEPSEVIDRLAQMKGRVLRLKIIELNRNRNRLILSERLALQEQRSHRKDELLAELQPGQVRKGRVTSLASFGAFVDLGGADGLVHISQLSYSRVNHPSEVLAVGDEVDVYVLSIDPDTKKIALSLKKAQPDPWSQVDQKYHVGDLVEGTITKLAKFGAFAKIDDGIEGLIHLSELSENAVENGQDVVSEGQRVTLRVININPSRRRLGLSLRQVENPSPGIKAVLEGGELPPDADSAEELAWTEDGGSSVGDE